MSDAVVIKANSIAKTFQDGKRKITVLKEIDLAVKRGEMVALVGASGEGKSTLLQILGGLDRPSAGSALICGTNITALTTKQQSLLRNRRLGFVYQFHHLLPEFDALENVAMPLLIRGMNKVDAKSEARAILDQVGLAERHTHRVGELSGGERQRVAIARALVTKPAAILADEPTGNLDHKTAAKILELLLSLNEQLKISFLIATHDLALAKKMDRILTLKDGMVLHAV